MINHNDGDSDGDEDHDDHDDVFVDLVHCAFF